MEKDELVKRKNVPTANPAKAEITFNAPVEGFVGHADKVDNNYHQVFFGQIPTDPDLIDDDSEPQQTLFRRGYYNLFVCSCSEKIGGQHDHFFVTRDRVLTEGYTIPEIVEKVRGFSEDAKEKIMSSPALICNENPATRKAGKKQITYLSKITQINVQETGVMIYYTPIMNLSQQRINDHQAELGISIRDYFDEMMHTHWAIKQIDLFQVLDDIGIRMW